MADGRPTYDLVLLLDPQAQEETRAKIVSSVRETISSQGELLRHDEWGERPLAYPIEHRPTAEYHLVQFQASDTKWIAGLSRTLRITDGIVRYRINKLKPGTPEAPDLRSQRGFAAEYAPEAHEPASRPVVSAT